MKVVDGNGAYITQHLAYISKHDCRFALPSHASRFVSSQADAGVDSLGRLCKQQAGRPAGKELSAPPKSQVKHRMAHAHLSRSLPLKAAVRQYTYVCSLCSPEASSSVGPARSLLLARFALTEAAADVVSYVLHSTALSSQAIQWFPPLEVGRHALLAL